MKHRAYALTLALIACLYGAAWFGTILIAEKQETQGRVPSFPILHADVPPDTYPVYQGDSLEYATLARSLLEGTGFWNHGMAETFRTPGYPFFIAAVLSVSGSFFAVTFVQILLVFLAAYMVQKIGTTYFSRPIGQLASIFFLLNPSCFIGSLTIMSDVLFAVLFIFGTYLLMIGAEHAKRLRGVLAACIFAASIYVRPMGFFALPIFFAPLAAVKWAWKEKVLAAAIIAVVVGVSTIPWILRNDVVTGVPSFTSLLSSNLAGVNVPAYLSWRDGTSFDDTKAAIEKESGLPFHLWYDLRFSEKLDAITHPILLGEPVSYMTFHLLSSTKFWYSVPNNFSAVARVIPDSVWAFGTQGIQILLLLLAILGAYLWRRVPFAWSCVFINVYLAFLSGPGADARYELPATAFLFLLASAGIVYLVGRIRAVKTEVL